MSLDIPDIISAVSTEGLLAVDKPGAMGKRRRHALDGERLSESGPSKKSRNVAQDLRDASLSDYVLTDGLRFVRPYQHQFVMTCKRRWRGRPVLEVLESELEKSSPNFWKQEFEGGRITVNGQPVSPTHLWGAQDRIVHSLHRHESPVVMNDSVSVVLEDDRLLVIDKPASVPVHPCGTYRKNSLMYILSAFGWKDLRVVHRLDKQTSGIVIFGKTREAAAEMCDDIKMRSVRKRYLARVQGRFPGDCAVLCDEALVVDETTNSTRVHPHGRDAETLFLAIAYDESVGHSLVVAEPLSGRSHQIRVHLQHLGYPIANDPLYNECTRKSLALAKKMRGCGLESLPHRLRVDELDDAKFGDSSDIAATGAALGCKTCPYLANPIGVDRESDMAMYLHALEYNGEGWSFRTRIPQWAEAFVGIDVKSCLEATPTLHKLPRTKLPRRTTSADTLSLLPRTLSTWCSIT